MFGGFKRFRAVVNAMNGKITYQRLTEEERRNVDLQARMLYASGGAAPSGDALLKASEAADTFKDYNEFELYSLYSMAMADGYIQPATPEPWDPPANPFSLRIKDADVAKATRHFKVNHGIDVSLDLTWAT